MLFSVQLFLHLLFRKLFLCIRCFLSQIFLSSICLFFKSLSSNPISLPTVSPTEILEPGDPTKVPTQTTSPSQFPIHSPTEIPTEQPTLNPTESPSIFLTQRPTMDSLTGIPTTDLPSQFPTFLPTNTPTKQPTHLPTTSNFPFSYSDTYFNYNPFSEYGPQYWEDVEIDRDNKYLQMNVW